MKAIVPSSLCGFSSTELALSKESTSGPCGNMEFEGKTFKSVTQDDISSDGSDGSDKSEASRSVLDFIEWGRRILKEEVADIRVSTRLTESSVCLVASEQGPDRQLEKILQGAGRLQTASKPVLEINAQSSLIQSIAKVTDDEFREDAAWLLLDEARILDGDRPKDPRAFATRQAKLFALALKQR